MKSGEKLLMGRFESEASGGVNLSTVRAIAETGCKLYFCGCT